MYSAQPPNRCGGVGCAQVVPVVRHVLAGEVREVAPAVVALAADDVGADDDAVPDLERLAVEVRVRPPAARRADRRHRADVLVALDDRERDLLRGLGAGVLRRVALVRVLVRPADARERHPHDDAARGRIRHRVVADLVAARARRGSRRARGLGFRSGVTAGWRSSEDPFLELDAEPRLLGHLHHSVLHHAAASSASTGTRCGRERRRIVRELEVRRVGDRRGQVEVGDRAEGVAPASEGSPGPTAAGRAWPGPAGRASPSQSVTSGWRMW